MPLSRALLLGLALLWAAPASAHPGHDPKLPCFKVFSAPQQGGAVQQMGTCVGEKKPPLAPADLDKPPFFFQHKAKVKIAGDELKIWEQLGYKLIAPTGALMRPTGLFETEAWVEHLRAPFNAGHETQPAFVWMGLHQEGYRLDEATCELVNGNKEKATRLELKVYAWWTARQLELLAVQSLHAMLAKLDPSKPVPPEIATRIDQIKSSQMTLPGDLEAKIRGAKSVKEALAAVNLSHTAALKFWDGHTETKELLENAKPPVLGYGQNRGKAYFDGTESKLGAVLGEDFKKELMSVEPGVELIDRFKNAQGAVELPRVAIWKISQRPDDPGYGNSAAVYNSDQDAVVINYWYAVGVMVDRAPEAERKKLAKDLESPQKLNAYLLAHPKSRQAIVEAVDMTMFHELTHAWQARRSKASVEAGRGNLPAANPVEDEIEAFRDENRYFHAKLMKDPLKLISHPEAGQYFTMLSGYDDFSKGIRRTYLENFGATADFPTIKTMQANRKGIFDGFSGWSPGSWLRKALRGQGMERGDKAINDSEAINAKLTKEFVEKEMPRMRKEAAPALIAAFEKDGAPHRALSTVAGMPGLVAPAELDRLEKAALAQIDGLKPEQVWEKAHRWDHIEKAYDLRGKDMAPALEKKMRKDYSAMSRMYIQSAKTAPNPAIKKDMLEWAKTYALKSDDKANLQQMIREVESKAVQAQ